MLSVSPPGINWEMKVYSGIPDPKTVIILVVTATRRGLHPGSMLVVC